MPPWTHIISGKNGHKKRKFGRRAGFCPSRSRMEKSKELKSKFETKDIMKCSVMSWKSYESIWKYHVIRYGCSVGGLVMLVNISNGHHLHIDQLQLQHPKSESISLSKSTKIKYLGHHIWWNMTMMMMVMMMMMTQVSHVISTAKWPLWCNFLHHLSVPKVNLKPLQLH